MPLLKQKRMMKICLISETRDGTIQTLSATVGEFNELSKIVAKLVASVQELSERGENHVSSTTKDD